MNELEIMAGLKAGKTLCVDRKDFPHLSWLLKLAEQGVLVAELVQMDSQSSVMKFRIAGKQ